MTVLKVKIGEAWEAIGGTGVGVPPGGLLDQVLTKTSSADYATAWQTPTMPILPNNTSLQGYKADGTTLMALIGVTAFDEILIGATLPAGKNIYVPRLTVQGALTLTDQQSVLSGSYQIILPWSPNNRVYFAHNCDASFNAVSGSTDFATINVAGTIYKGGVAYVHPDYVFEHHATGRVEKFAGAPGAKDYEGLLPLSDVETHTREHWRLPHHVRDGTYDLFRRGDELLAEVEHTYLYLFDHERRLKALEAAATP